MSTKHDKVAMQKEFRNTYAAAGAGAAAAGAAGSLGPYKKRKHYVSSWNLSKTKKRIKSMAIKKE
jgi:hypothetical protein